MRYNAPMAEPSFFTACQQPLQYRWPRAVALTSLLLLVALATWFLYYTEIGQHLRQTRLVQEWVHRQPVIAPLIFILAYCLVGILALPVWWLQILAGHCFGLAMGLLWCHLAAVAATAISARLAQWLVGPWLHRRLQPYHRRLQAIDQKLDHNGLLVVTAARLSHVMPFGLTNYLLGLSRIRLGSMLLGTVLGGTLSKMIHITLGADPHMLGNRRYLAALVGINLLLLSPLLLRYLWPPRQATVSGI